TAADSATDPTGPSSAGSKLSRQRSSRASTCRRVLVCDLMTETPRRVDAVCGIMRGSPIRRADRAPGRCRAGGACLAVRTSPAALFLVQAATTSVVTELASHQPYRRPAVERTARGDFFRWSPSRTLASRSGDVPGSLPVGLLQRRGHHLAPWEDALVYEPNTFTEFIRRIRAGDEQAAVELVRHYEPLIRREVRLQLEDQRLCRLFDSMDVCQSVLKSSFSRTATGEYDLDTREQLQRLLVTMARNKLASAARSEHRWRRDNRRVAADGAEQLEGVADDAPSP